MEVVWKRLPRPAGRGLQKVEWISSIQGQHSMLITLRGILFLGSCEQGVLAWGLYVIIWHLACLGFQLFCFEALHSC